MSEPLSEKRLAEIEARAKAATAGPWETDEGGCCVYEVGFGTREDTLTGPVAQVVISADGTYADAAFIAHARADVPDLLAEIRRLRSLFPDPEADALVCRSAARAFSLQGEDGGYSDITSELDDIAARLRQISPTDTGERTDG